MSHQRETVTLLRAPRPVPQSSTILVRVPSPPGLRQAPQPQVCACTGVSPGRRTGEPYQPRILPCNRPWGKSSLAQPRVCGEGTWHRMHAARCDALLLLSLCVVQFIKPKYNGNKKQKSADCPYPSNLGCCGWNGSPALNALLEIDPHHAASSHYCQPSRGWQVARKSEAIPSHRTRHSRQRRKRSANTFGLVSGDATVHVN